MTAHDTLSRRKIKKNRGKNRLPILLIILDVDPYIQLSYRTYDVTCDVMAGQETGSLFSTDRDCGFITGVKGTIVPKGP